MRFAKHPKRERKNQQAEPRLPKLDRIVSKSQNVGKNKERRQDTKPGHRYHKEESFEHSTNNPSLAGAPAPSSVRVANDEPAHRADAPYDFGREQNHGSNSALSETVALCALAKKSSRPNGLVVHILVSRGPQIIMK